MTSKDTTFTSFTPEQAAAYASGRGAAYPKALYDQLLSYHKGDRETFLDVGTGPGKVVWDLLPSFQRGFGCDTSSEMIAQAVKDAEKRGVSDRANFYVSGGELCGHVYHGPSVDLITVAMAAHWFDLPAFYASAAKILKPGGTLAIWTCSSTFVHPSTPNHEEIQAILKDLEGRMLAPYRTPGNVLSSNGYDDLTLPWTLSDTKDLFDQTSFMRKDWDRNGVPSAPPLADGSPGPFVFLDHPGTVQYFLAAIGSASMVIRWREANPTKAHTDEDPVNITARRLREATGGSEMLWICPSVSLLLMRRA